MATPIGYQQKGSPRFPSRLGQSEAGGEAGNALMIGIIVIVLAVGAYLYFSSQKSDQSADNNPNTAEENDIINQNQNNAEGTTMPVPAPDNNNVNEMIVNESPDKASANVNADVNANVDLGNDNGNTNSQPVVKSFTVTAQNFSFSPAEIRVKKGDQVRITLNNASGFHDWVLDEFNARTKQMQGPSTETVEFTADKTGTFEYYCSVGTHRQMGMKGNLIVE